MRLAARKIHDDQLDRMTADDSIASIERKHGEQMLLTRKDIYNTRQKQQRLDMGDLLPVQQMIEERNEDCVLYEEHDEVTMRLKRLVLFP